MSERQCRAEWVRRWWSALRSDGTDTSAFFFDRTVLARLRRCRSLNEVALQSCVWPLEQRLGLGISQKEGLFIIASALAHVRSDANDGKSLAYRLGAGPTVKGMRPLMSELRFLRLMRAVNAEDFLAQLHRVLMIGDGITDVAILAEDILDWVAEGECYPPWGHGMKYRWASDYYLKRKDQDLLREVILSAAD